MELENLDWQEAEEHDGTSAESQFLGKEQSEAPPSEDSAKLEPHMMYKYEQAKPRDGGWGWFVVVGCAVMHVLQVGTERTFGLVYLEIEDMFGGSSALTAWIGSILTAFRMGFGPVASILCNKFGCRRVVMIGSVVVLIALILSAVPPNKVYLVFTWGVLFGIGGALVYTPSFIAVGQNFDKRRAIANGISTAGAGVGQFAMPQIYRLCLNSYGYMGSMLIVAALSFNMLNCGALYRPLKPVRKLVEVELADIELQNLKDGKLEDSKDGKEEAKKRKKGCCGRTKVVKDKNDNKALAVKKKLFNPELFKEPNFVLFAFCVGLTTMSYIPTTTFLPALAVQRGFTKTDGSILLSVIGASDMVGRLSCGFVFDQKKVRSARRYIYCATPFILSFFMCMIPQCQSLSHFIALCVFYGISVGMFVSQIASLLADWCGKEKLASALGLLMWFRGTGVLVGPTIGGLIKDATKSYNQTFYFQAAVAFLGGLVYVLLLIVMRALKKRQKEKNGGMDPEAYPAVD
ncbi:monocarboxylate transporter 4-like [Lineus longissimus]|uniref:monocarboxylate transporter 4-like n=1 Tax=Lineus longissimus TaxID=88925 RepID=UPI002B4D3AA6